MIKISNGNVEKMVTVGAYNELYKPLGYEPIEIKKEEVSKKSDEIKDTDKKKESIVNDKVNKENTTRVVKGKRK